MGAHGQIQQDTEEGRYLDEVKLTLLLYDAPDLMVDNEPVSDFAVLTIARSELNIGKIW